MFEHKTLTPRAAILLVCLALACLPAASASAQTFRGAILGTVTDPNGAVVGGATVRARNVGTGLERSTMTDADGDYTIAELPIGTYEVTVEQTGFTSIFVTAPDGLRLHVRSYGAPGERTLPIVCLPGLTRNGADFHDLALALALAPRLVAGGLPDGLGCLRAPVGFDGRHLRASWLDYQGEDVLAAVVREHGA